ncbi:50S ribosomal protein L4 [Patescibacteria group bacterium]|nr:50S ribosomal protein L4 [Patescibacteria group bacterium]MBU1931279.1 50S ribosomal protein L4 [Patescibacteria group bacterium]
MTLTTSVYDTTGKKSGTIKLSKEIFGVEINKVLITQAIRVYLNNQRQARAKTKTRGEVAGSGRKIWKQKGTGRARHGSNTAPIFVGGGVAHGPKGTPPKRLKMSKPLRRQALFSSLSWQAKNQNILILKQTDKFPPKTKKANQLFTKILGKNLPASLLINYNLSVNFKKAVNNLPYLELLSVNQLNVYKLLKAKKLVFTPAVLEQMEKMFLTK